MISMFARDVFERPRICLAQTFSQTIANGMTRFLKKKTIQRTYFMLF